MATKWLYVEKKKQKKIKINKAADLRGRKTKGMINEGVTGFPLKVKRLGKMGGKKRRETQIALFWLSFPLKGRRGGREDLERSVRWRIFFPFEM